MKVCSQCKQRKGLGCFAKQKTGKQGRRADCKECVKRFIRSERGIAKQILSNQKAKSRKRGYQPPAYTEQELYDWLISQPLFKPLYVSWVASGYKTKIKPSIDRIDDYQSYTLTNVQLSTVQENTDRYLKDAMNGDNTKMCSAVDMFRLDGLFIRRFHSVSDAARETGISRSAIGRVCSGKVICRKKADGSVRSYIASKAGGCKWRYSVKPNENKEIIL